MLVPESRVVSVAVIVAKRMLSNSAPIMSHEGASSMIGMLLSSWEQRILGLNLVQARLSVDYSLFHQAHNKMTGVATGKIGATTRDKVGFS